MEEDLLLEHTKLNIVLFWIRYLWVRSEWSHVQVLGLGLYALPNSSVNDSNCFLVFDIQLLPVLVRSNDQRASLDPGL